MPWHGDVATYPLVVRKLKLDIGLCPLKSDEFNHGKSPLKWMEYSAMKIPSVASPVVYGNYIENNKTGLIARDDWFDQIESLIKSKEKRKRLANNAFQYVKKKFSQDKNVDMWWSALNDVMD